MPRKGWPLAPAFGGCGLDGAWRSAEVCHQEIDGEVWPCCNFKPLVFSQFRTAVDKGYRFGDFIFTPGPWHRGRSGFMYSHFEA